MTNRSEKISIAICGGGIAAVCLAYGLLQHTHLDVKIYEANQILREDGAAVGLGGNAQEALQLLGPEMRAALDKAGGTRMTPSIRYMMGTGVHAGKHILDVDSSKSQIIVHRGPFLRQLRELLPNGVLQLGKRLKTARATDGGIDLEFVDGSHVHADAVIGCDGINSIIRKAILGESAAQAVYVGGYAFRTVIPIQRAAKVFGDEYVKQQTQHAWIGHGGFHLTDLVDNASAMQVIAGWSSSQPWPFDSPYVPWPKDRFIKGMEGWERSISQPMIKVFTEQDTLYAAGSRIHRATPTVAKDNMSIAGDAAHAMMPFLGAGAGQAIEDAVILSTVLDQVRSAEDVKYAFHVYDTVRRPRRLRIAELSMGAAMLDTGGRLDVGTDLEKMKIALQENGGSEAYDHHVKTDQLKAAELMIEALNSGKCRD